MRAAVRREMQQAELRAQRCEKSEKAPALELSELRRRIMALVLNVNRGWDAARIARHFNWPVEDVTRWLESGIGKVL